MAHASIVPSLDADIHLVLCRFGRAGLAYIETDPAEADATTVVQNLLYGRYGQPLRVVALNVDEGWSQDVSEAMARKVLEIAEREDYELTGDAAVPRGAQPIGGSADITRGSRHGVRRPVARAWMRYSGRAKRGGARVTAGALLRCGKSLSAVCRLPMPPLALSDAFSLPKLRPSKRTEPREG
jgi:hypothetical protein